MKLTIENLKKLIEESTQEEFKEIVKQAYPKTDKKTRKMIIDLYTAEGWYPDDVDELKDDLPDLINARCEPAKAKFLTNAIAGNIEAKNNGYGVFLRGELKAKFKTWDAANEWANEKYDLDVYGDDVTIDPLTDDEAEELHGNVSECDVITEDRSWSDFDKFDEVLSDYLPATGEGDTMASQIATALCKIVYRWFNDGDVYDNTTNGINTYNDLSDYANWLYKYVPEADRVAEIVDYDGLCSFDDFYAELLYGLCTDLVNVIEKYAAEPKTGSVYNCTGPFKCVEDEEDEEENY